LSSSGSDCCDFIGSCVAQVCNEATSAALDTSSTLAGRTRCIAVLLNVSHLQLELGELSFGDFPVISLQLAAQEPAIDSKQEELRAARVLFYSLLDEQQRRLYAGLDEQTVARGRHELLAGKVQRKRIRRGGGGRPRAEKKTPDIANWATCFKKTPPETSAADEVCGQANALGKSPGNSMS